jgi:hypothetical protein
LALSLFPLKKHFYWFLVFGFWFLVGFGLVWFGLVWFGLVWFGFGKML